MDNASQHEPKSEVSSDQQDWLSLALSILCLFLIVGNILLFQKYTTEHAKRKKLEQEKIQRQQKMMRQLFSEQAHWQVQIKVTYPLLEKTIDHWSKQEYAEIVESLKEEHEYSSIPIFYYILGMSHAALNQDDKAIENLSRYLDVVCFSSQALYQRARLYQKQGKHDLAKEDLDRISEQDPNFFLRKELQEKIQQDVKEEQKSPSEK